MSTNKKSEPTKFRAIPTSPPLAMLNAGWHEIDLLGGDPEAVELGAIYSAMIATITEVGANWCTSPAPAGHLWVPAELPVEILNAGWNEHAALGGDPEELELGVVWVAMMRHLDKQAPAEYAFRA